MKDTQKEIRNAFRLREGEKSEKCPNGCNGQVGRATPLGERQGKKFFCFECGKDF